MTPEPKEACINCQLFGLLTRGGTVVLDLKSREDVREKDLEFLLLDNEIGCHARFWVAGNRSSRGLLATGENVYREAVATERRGTCYFWPRRAGLDPDTALLMHQQQAERNKAAQDRRLTIAVALGSIAVTALCQLLTAVLQLQAINKLVSDVLRPWLPP